MKHTNIKFSIIVPVYNAEKYLERCLTSLLDQDLDSSEFEIIAVNDGSKDASESILQRMGEVHSNIRWVTTVNQGVSEARNQGCRMAEGRYLLFVDSDDSVAPNTLGKIYETLEANQLDVLVMDYTYWDDKNEKHLFSEQFQNSQIAQNVMTGKDFMQVCIPQVVWCSAYRTDFWKENKLSYLPIRHEDEEILPRIFYYAKRVLFCPIMFYCYFRNPDSFMMNYDVKACRHLVNAMRSVERYRRTQVKEPELDMFFQNLIASRLLSVVIQGIHCGISHDELLSVVLEMKKDGLAPLPKGKKGLHKFLFNHWPSGFITYYRIKKRRRK